MTKNHKKAAKRLLKENPDFFKEIGRKGGLRTKTGFYADPERARKAARKRWASAKKPINPV